MQVIHKLSKRPTMGDQKLEGRGENLQFADFALSIDQGRHIVDAGGKMSQQRFKHDLRSAARRLLGTYFNDLQDQCAVVHLAGTRGDFMADDIILPPADHPEFARIMVNEVMPPTYDRHFSPVMRPPLNCWMRRIYSAWRQWTISLSTWTKWRTRCSRSGCRAMS